MKVIEKYRDTEIGRLLSQGAVSEVIKQSARRLTEAKVAEIVQ